MKARFIQIFFILFVFVISAAGQQLKEDELPPGLIYEFRNRFPEADNVRWSINQEMYQADFGFMGNNVISFYDMSAKWLSAETFYLTENLPRNIQRYISSQFPEHNIKNSRFIEKKGESGYFRIETSENNEVRFVEFDKDGLFQSMTDASGEEIVSSEISSDPGTKAITTKELPSQIVSYIQKYYPAYRITQRYLINNTEWENTYYIILASNLEKEKVQLWFDYKGELVKEIDPNVVVTNYTEEPQDGKQSKKKSAEGKKGLSENMVPQPVRDAFKKQVKRSEKVSWDTLKGNYFASYFDPVKNGKFRSEFTAKGVWVQTFGELNPKTLNMNVLKHLETNYPVLKIYSAESLYTSDKKRYTLVKIYDPKWLNNPMVYHELYFSQSGKLELENYADFMAPGDQQIGQNNKSNNEIFLENVDSEDLGTSIEYRKITTKEMPSKILKYIKETYPEHRITETYIVPDDETGETLYWVILRKEGIRVKTKVVFDFNGVFRFDEEL